MGIFRRPSMRSRSTVVLYLPTLIGRNDAYKGVLAYGGMVNFSGLKKKHEILDSVISMGRKG
jgi:hypothetical protein